MWDLQSRLTPSLFDLDLEGAKELWEKLDNWIIDYIAQKPLAIVE